MNIVFYNNMSDNRTIGKTYNQTTSLNGTLKAPCSIEKPSIIIENHGMINGNYCYIEQFGRYYFILDQTILSNNRVKIDMAVDVLETYKNQIKSLNCIIENSANDFDKYLSSDIWKTLVKTKTDIITFPSGFNSSGEFILITAGG